MFRMHNAHQRNWGSVKISLMLVMMCWVTFTTAADCQYDLSPCSCSFNEVDNSYATTCSDVPMADVATTFQSKPALDINNLVLGIRAEGDFIPADLLGQSRMTGQLGIYGLNSILIVDPNAFRSSKNSSLESVTFNYLDTSRMDFDFLTDFPRIASMVFTYVLNLERSLPTLPFLASLTYLNFVQSSNINKAFADSFLKCNGLKSIQILATSVPLMEDEGLSALVNWLLPSSANTLENILFNDHSTSLTKTPTQLGSLENISKISMVGNLLNMTISTGSINSKSAGMDFKITDSNIVSVEEGAFLGNWARTSMYLNSNSLTRFEAGAFKSVLEQMASSIGFVSVYSNPFDCYTDPCHLAWLCRDNRNLLSNVEGAKCDGTGESFEQMSPDYFTNCPY